jgi:hypothetical protein
MEQQPDRYTWQKEGGAANRQFQRVFARLVLDGYQRTFFESTPAGTSASTHTRYQKGRIQVILGALYGTIARANRYEITVRLLPEENRI